MKAGTPIDLSTICVVRRRKKSRPQVVRLILSVLIFHAPHTDSPYAVPKVYRNWSPPLACDDKCILDAYDEVMAQKHIIPKVVTLIGAGGTAATLFWMSLYLVGSEALFAGAIALAIGIPWLTRGVHSVWALTERLLVACLLAAQASLLLAAILKVIPVMLGRTI